MTIFAQFKSNQGLSIRDLSEIFNKHPKDIQLWVEGGAPSEITNIAIICNDVLERQKLKDMPDIDRQQFEHRSELLVKENNRLKAEIAELKLEAVHSKNVYSEPLNPEDESVYLAHERKMIGDGK